MSKKTPKILIVGTGDLRNYGCEAIVHGTAKMIAEEWPEARIYLASTEPDYDSRFIPDNVVPVKYLQRFTLKRIYKGILRRFLKIGNGSDVRMNTKIGRRYDIVLSAGGDNYCQTPDGGIYNLLRDLMAIGEDTVRHGKRYVLWGASVGPFSRKEIKDIVLSNLSLTSLINVREEQAYNYLKKESDEELNLHLVADPAFYMDKLPYTIDNPVNKVLIGVNLSLLALNHRGVSAENGIKELVSQLKLLNKRHPDWKFIGVPHVELDFDAQNDFAVLDCIEGMIADKSVFESLPKDLGARKTKGAIANLNLLVAARMHCCVGGVSQGVPTLFLTYSPKGAGMAKYAYGDERYTLDCSEIGSQEFVALVEEMIQNEEEIKEVLKSKQIEMKNGAFRGVKLLKEMYENG